MAEQENPRNQMPMESVEETQGELEKAKVEAKVVRRRAKSDERASHKAEKASVKAQEALSAVQAEVDQEQQAHVKAEKSKADTQRALEEASMPTRGLGENLETPLKTLGEKETERRVSFIVRLTLDERGEPRRTEIEYTKTRKKESFPALDGERLVAFMRTSVSAVAIAEPAISQATPAVPMRIPTLEPASQTSSLTVSDIRIFRTGVPGTMALTLSPEEAFVVQAHFQIQSTEVVYPPTQKSTYEMMIYANKVASGESKLLTTYSGNLAKDILEDTVQTEVPGLSSGVYRLVTLVILRTPIEAAGYHEGPILQVS